MEIAPGCIFDHVKISPDRQIPEHTQETLEISLVLRGSGKFCTGKAVRPFSPGELFLIPSGIPHFWKFREDDTGPSGEIENISNLSYFCRTFKRLSGYSPSRTGDNSRTTEQGQMPW